MGQRDGGELQSERFQTTALGIGRTFEPGEIEPDESSVRARERPEDLPEHPLALDAQTQREVIKRSMSRAADSETARPSS